MYFLDYLHPNGNVLPSHLRLSCNWEKDLQNPHFMYSISSEEENGNLKNSCLWTRQQRVKGFLIPPHFWGRICTEPRKSIPGNQDSRAGLQFLCQGWIFGITGSPSPAWCNYYEHIWCHLQSLQALCSLPSLSFVCSSYSCAAWVWVGLESLYLLSVQLSVLGWNIKMLF